MSIYQLVASVNSARAREDYLYRNSKEIKKGKLASPKIQFQFKGKQFYSELPYGLRVTIGVVLSHLNSTGCYINDFGFVRRVVFSADVSGDVTWTVF